MDDRGKKSSKLGSFGRAFVDDGGKKSAKLCGFGRAFMDDRCEQSAKLCDRHVYTLTTSYLHLGVSVPSQAKLSPGATGADA